MFVSAGTAYIMCYAKKVKNNPKCSFVFDEDRTKRALYLNKPGSEIYKVNKKQKIALFF
ncbi:hypothetical protein RCO48_18340 [Peribacillus frigoritolerans]|nr:hypothetical protein [Peribacillus frigoritolerans]